MNTSSYSREPPSPKRATPQNTSVGEKASLPSGNPHLGRETKLYHLPGPTVDELLQRLNGNAPPTKMIGRKAPGTNGFVLACDAVPWKSSAQREAERPEMMRQQAEEEEERKKKVKSLSSQLPPSFATSSQDVDKENAEGRRDVRDGKKCENVPKNALGAPLKTVKTVHTDIAHTAKAKRTTRTDALIPVHTGTAHTANINTLIERSAPTPPKGRGKRSLVSANDLPSPIIERKERQNRNAKTENPTNDALPLAFEDPAKPTPLTNPFSVDTSRKLDFDLELPADLPGFLSASCAKAGSSPSESFLPDNDDDVFFPSIDAPMPELNSRKRTFPSSRSTDAKTSETSVVDDATQPPPNSSPGEQQPQQQRVYKKVNKRVNKKVKRES